MSSKVPKVPKTDPRLLGTWKSDKRQTFADWNWKKHTPPGKKARLKSLFGKLTLTFTRNAVISSLPHREWQSCRNYSILARDETSVAIVEFGWELKKSHKDSDPELKDFFSKPAIKHIHFDKNYIWFSIGNGRNREFFRKIS